MQSLMDNAPTLVDEKQLKELHLTIRAAEKMADVPIGDKQMGAVA